jgi:VanZ family protein
MAAMIGRIRRPGWLRWLPMLAMMALIFVLSSQSGLKVSEDPAIDKPFRVTGHLLAYALLAAATLVGSSWGRRPGWRDAALALSVSLLYGLSDELHQSFVPDRTGRLDDVATDLLGAMVGTSLAWLGLLRAAHRREDRSRATPERPA